MRNAIVDDPPDAVLLDAVRAGDLGAWDALFRRHAGPLRRTTAGWPAQPADHDDLIAEAFIRVLSTVRAGSGPRESLRPYLVVTMRNLAANWGRHRNRIELYGTAPETEEDAHVAGGEELAVRRWNEQLVWSAYSTLPGRWRTVLWRTEAEGDSPRELAPLLGISPNGVTVLARRAREGLRQAYLQAQVPAVTTPQCLAARRRMGTWVRGGVPQRQAGLIADHLAGCESCWTVASRLAEANRELPPAASSRPVEGRYP
ncbi:RNA polymerase sigma factor [Amycolatopsis nigrescens]|uniref:RNA polymerase sigma factor n=1 Tax=Amycolatopsis nigrescens TaxID=381445 RepID=UPI0003A55845|nr:sigma-70 family RNA polymerase sigma factor [Amycolatopsis nigrescens]